MLLAANTFTAQNVDSLKLALKNASHDTIRCNILSQLAESASEEEWPKFNDELKKLSEKNALLFPDPSPSHNFYLKHFATSLSNIGFLAKQNGDISKALEYLIKGFEIQKRIGLDKNGLAASLNNIGFIFREQGNVQQALEYYMQALKIMEVSGGDKIGIASTLSNIGYIYSQQGDKLKALEYYRKSFKISTEIGNKKGIGYSLNNIGGIYFALNDLLNAKENYEKSYKVHNEIGDKKGEAYLLNNIGLIYMKQGNLEKAFECYQNSLKLREEVGDKSGIVYSLHHLSELFVIKKEFDKAFKCAARAMQLSTELGFPESIMNAAKVLQDVYSVRGDFGNSLKYLELYYQMRDSVINIQNKKAAIKNELKYTFDKKAAQDSVKNAEQNVREVIKRKQSIRQQQLYTSCGILGFIMMLVIAIVSFRAFRNKKKANQIISDQKKIVEEQKHIVEEKQKEILDSIYYALRIQRALITNEKYIEKKLNQYN